MRSHIWLVPRLSWRLATWLSLVVAVAVGCNDAHPGFVARDPVLRDAPVVLYPAADRARAPRAIVFFFGNDVGFWRPHQALAWSLSREQYAVAGFDIRRLLGSLPEDTAQRDSVAADRLARYIAAARRELGDTLRASVPFVLAGHSIGSELALWAAAHLSLDGLSGVLAMSPGNRSHLTISPSDLLMTSEPTGPGSFSVAEQVTLLGRRSGAPIRVAIVRGARDKLADADPALLAAGGAMARRWVVPFSGHSLKSQLLAPHYVQDALDWLLDPPSRGGAAVRATVATAARDGGRAADEGGNPAAPADGFPCTKEEAGGGGIPRRR